MPSPERVYKKRAGQNNFLILIPKKKGFLSQICPSYAYPAEKSKLLVLCSTSFFICSYYFDFSYPLSLANVSLDCASLERQINQWKASNTSIRNTNDLENFQMSFQMSFKKLRNFCLIPKGCVILNVQRRLCFTKVCEMGRIFD